MVVASIAVLLLITYIPVISTFLPAALGSAAAVENGTTTGGDSGTTATDNEDFNTIEDYSDLDWPEMTWNLPVLPQRPVPGHRPAASLVS